MKRFLLIFCMLILWVLQGCQVLINPHADLIVIDPDGNNIENNTGVYEFGDVMLNTSPIATFTIENLGKKTLELTDSPAISITGNDHSYFSVTSSPDSLIKTGKSTTFSIKFTPIGLGSYTTTIEIKNNTDDANPFVFSITAECVQPEMLVKQGSASILASTGIYDFGNVHYSKNSAAIVFDITNVGTGELILNGNPKIQLTGNDSAMFEIDQSAVESSLVADESTSFALTFKPTSGGLKTAYISISSNDPIHNTYAFTIKGTCLVPEMHIKQGNNDIPDSTGWHHFSKLIIGQSSAEITFTIYNTGLGDLFLFGTPFIKISGTDSSMFAIDQTNTTSTIAQGNTTTFTIKFTPTSDGQKSAFISIVNNDPDKNPYTFNVYGSATYYLWTKRFGSNDYDSVNDSTTDPDGNVYLVGSFENTVNFGSDFGLTDIKTSDASNSIRSDCFITRINANGTYGWTKHFGGAYQDSCNAVETDSDGNVYILGFIGDTVDFGVDFGITDVKSTASGLRGFVMKISPNGSYLWTKLVAESITFSLDSNRNIYLVGHIKNTVNFGADFGVNDTRIATGNIDFFITKINANLTYGWTRLFNGSSYNYVFTVTTDSLNNIYLTGRFTNSINFGADFGVTDTKSANGYDTFIVKINSNGSYGWTKKIGSYNTSTGRNCTTDKDNNLYIAGTFEGTINFGADFGKSDIKTCSGLNDIFLLKINANGTYGWTKRFAGVEKEYMGNVCCDSTGNIYVAGFFHQTIDFGTDFGVSDPKTAKGEADAFITKINANGTYGWTKRIGGNSGCVCYSIHYDPNGFIYLTGLFYGTVNFGEDFGETDNKTCAGEYDGYITKLAVN